jgi:predicted metal-binding protein
MTDFAPVPHPELKLQETRMSDIGPAGRATVMVCITCRAATGPADRTGIALAEATAVAAQAASDISVQRIRCLGNCSRGLSAAIRCDNTWTYVFGGLEPARDGPSLIIGAQLLAQAADGIMPWRGRPESLKRGLIARVPPSNFREELP